MARRPSALAVLVLVLVTMTGCRVEGRVEVRAVSAVDVDVTVSGERSPYCNSDLVGLSTSPGREPGGVITSCRYIGVVDPANLGWAMMSLASGGEYLVAVFNPFQVPFNGKGNGTDVDNEVNQLDVTVVMPGTVVETNSGTVSGNELRITDPDVLELPGGLRVVALNHPGPGLWVWWLSTGVLLGAAATMVVLTVRRRRANAAELPTDESRQADDEPAVAAAAEEVDPGGEAQSLPDGEQPNPSMWSRPEDESADPGPRRRAGHDPSIWAPEG